MAKKGDICPACGNKGSLEITDFYIFRTHDPEYSSEVHKYIGHVKYKYRVKCANCSFLYDTEHMDLLMGARKAEKAGRYEDAARIYEELNFLDKARSMRELNRTGTMKQVNLNTLIDQLRSGGLVVPYKCPNCGGTIKIDKDYNQGMKLCAYCGSPIDTTLIASLLGNL
jgi:rubrerythrin